MSYFWIALILLVALSPLVKAMPSRRQRLIADLRQTAALAGLYVQFRQSPLEAADAPPRVFYGRRRSREHALVGMAASYRRDTDGWVCIDGQWPANRLARLAALPSGVSVVIENIQGVGVFWDELGTVEDVASLERVLSSLLASTD